MPYNYNNTNEPQNNRRGCCCCNDILYGVITAFAGIIFAVVAGVLAGFGLLTNIPTLTAIVLGTALGVLALVIIGAIVSGVNKEENKLSTCLCRYLGGLLTGSIGTILLALITLGVTLTTASVAAIILTALLGLTFAILLTSLIFTIRCIVCDTDC